jgi:hypothetical protein
LIEKVLLPSRLRESNVSETPPHKKFEQQIERIHQLVEDEGSTVTWNDHIPEPDNPSQPRQIDVSIRLTAPSRSSSAAYTKIRRT